MILLPAIDIIDGKPVRLVQGDYNQKEIVASDVLDTAKSFEKAGAEYVHLVDLDGAKAGYPVNHEIICEVAGKLNTPVEAGGGIRKLSDIEYYLNHGVSRVILGTSALEDPKLLKEALSKYKEKIAVGIDARDGKVCTCGWLSSSDMDYLDFAGQMENLGVSTVIFTDISKDGTLAGPNLEMLKKLREAVNMNIIASGGIRDLSNIEELARLDLYGAIAGKSLYSGTLDLKEAILAGAKKHAD